MLPDMRESPFPPVPGLVPVLWGSSPLSIVASAFSPPSLRLIRKDGREREEESSPGVIFLGGLRSMFKICVFNLMFLETGSHYRAITDLEFALMLLLPPECWDYTLFTTLPSSIY